MTQINFDIPDNEDEFIMECSKKWNLNKPKTILCIINKYKEMTNELS
jgi:hypothetical protein